MASHLGMITRISTSRSLRGVCSIIKDAHQPPSPVDPVIAVVEMFEMVDLPPLLQHISLKLQILPMF